MAIYNTTDLLTAIKKRGFIPTSQQTFTDTDILRLATEELQGNIMPWIVKYDQGYYAKKVAITLVDGQHSYKIPDRAAFRKIKDLYVVTSDGDVITLPKIHSTQTEFYGGSSPLPQAFYTEGDNIVLVPRVSSPTLNLEMVIFFRPNKLVAASRVRTVSSFTSSTITINTSSAPSHMTTSVKYDVIDAESGNSTLLYDLTATDITTDTITFSDTISGIKVGDEVVIAEETSYPQMPEELQTILQEYVVMRLFQSHGDQQGVNNSLNRIAMMQEDVANMIEDRVTGQATKLINRNSLTRQHTYASGRTVVRG